MRRVFPILVVLLALVAVSCDKDHPSGVIVKKPKAVDIGLVVNGKNIKWANFDLGATKEGARGYYYAWGELAPKAYYSRDKYAFANEEGKFTKYCWNNDSGKKYWGGTGENPDDLSVLLPDDDVAHKKLGGKWRLPTKEEVSALVMTKSNPDYSWYNGSCKQKDGSFLHYVSITQKSTGNSLIFPLSGYCEKGNTSMMYNESGFFWTSTLAPTADKATCMRISSASSALGDYDLRELGLCVRAVCE